MTRMQEGRATRAAATAGFTVLEVLVVLGVLALALALGVPALRGPGPQAVLAGQARGLQGLLVEARARAMETGGIINCEVDAEKRAIVMQPNGRPLQLPASLAIRATVPEPGLAAGRRAHLQFFPDGSASGLHIVLTAGTLAASITVDRMTGHVALAQGDR